MMLTSMHIIGRFMKGVFLTSTLFRRELIFKITHVFFLLLKEYSYSRTKRLYNTLKAYSNKVLLEYYIPPRTTHVVLTGVGRYSYSPMKRP